LTAFLIKKNQPLLAILLAKRGENLADTQSIIKTYSENASLLDTQEALANLGSCVATLALKEMPSEQSVEKGVCEGRASLAYLKRF